MSSLSGALDESAVKQAKQELPFPNDVEMHPEFNSAASGSENDSHEEQDEDMADLFGNDDVDEPKHERFEKFSCIT
jgi:hypothetical protein